MSYYEADGYRTIDIIRQLQLPFEAGNVVKYILRAGRKPGEPTIDALAKAAHYCQLAQEPVTTQTLVYTDVAKAFGQPPVAADILSAVHALDYCEAYNSLFEWIANEKR